MRALVIGCGYLGRRVAAIWRSEGMQVSALTRSSANAAMLADQGIEPVVGDVLLPETLRSLPPADVVLYAVGYDRQAAASKRDVYVRGLANALDNLSWQVRRLFYISSTSVYGQDRGEWVDETSETAPANEDGQIVLAAEQTVRQLCPPGAASVLRFAGIYGPGRLLRRIELVRRSEPIAGNPDGFLNLIHVDDGAQIVSRLAKRDSVEPTYLVTDDRPIRRREYYGLLARLVGATEPVFQFDASGERSGLNKRCSNARLEAQLGEILRFPTIDSGLAQAIGEHDS
ncbi:MAG TPA: SDR family oxidoreductase [Planctomycetaceae bacterium]|jgi:nucleoside-diphosphate-sugar epimerase|nr:SDR family oxidoreductase [Planctomycetaceae bacterium]